MEAVDVFKFGQVYIAGDHRKPDHKIYKDPPAAGGWEIGRAGGTKMDPEVKEAIERLRRVNNQLFELLESTLTENHKLLVLFNEGISGCAPFILSGILDEYCDEDLILDNSYQI